MRRTLPYPDYFKILELAYGFIDDPDYEAELIQRLEKEGIIEPEESDYPHTFFGNGSPAQANGEAQ